ncbi:S41 family peptidase [Neolewinella lacunae]|uniref:Tail specific protease domain-containing protein n=1 Tax=Neolewinella lacunae TaxID=1517758 RepID=A0A923PLQ7_9BACT|nr:S41 family peptidase [Neolewinella lacunae]MBC6993991.1 hypothetical protein [Neolewinella lacunae]MDN3634661.1 S41 family peptidase [Neolewinella lacunae]
MLIRSLFFSLLTLSSLQAQRMLPSAAVPEMVDAIYTNIRDSHPACFTAEGRAKVDGARAQVQGTLERIRMADSLSMLAFTQLVTPLQEATQCGHLILDPYVDSLQSLAIRENRFALSLYQVESGEFVLRSGLKTTTDSLPPGTVITALEGQPVEELVADFAHFSGVNDQGNDAASRTVAARVLPHYWQKYYGLQRELSFEFLAADGSQEERTILPTHQPYVDVKKVKTPIAETLSLGFSDSGETGILTIRSFKTMEFTDGNYYRFISTAIDSLNKLGTQNLIIDIRDNTGGSSGRIEALYRYFSEVPFQFAAAALLTGPARATPEASQRDLKAYSSGAVSKRERRMQKGLTRYIKPHKPERRFKGEVIVLVNEISFSASGMFARYVQGSGRGKVVGQRTGASAGVTYGGSSKTDRTFIGPNQEYELRVNTIALELPHARPGNVEPDVLVPITAAGLRAGKDETLEVALGMLE